MDYCLSNVLLLPSNRQLIEEKVVPNWVGSQHKSSQDNAPTATDATDVVTSLHSAGRSPRIALKFDNDIMRSHDTSSLGRSRRQSTIRPVQCADLGNAQEDIEQIESVSPALNFSTKSVISLAFYIRNSPDVKQSKNKMLLLKHDVHPKFLVCDGVY
jgi:hypothetical protein